MTNLKGLLKVLKILNCKGEAKVYLQNQDAEVFLDFHVVKDDAGNICLTLFDVEQVSGWEDD